MEENQIFGGRVLCHQRVRGPLPSTAGGKEYVCYYRGQVAQDFM